MILQGDCLQVLPTLDAQSVQMCVTSPPYYGLRDYGTANWKGGDPECDHAYQKGGRNPETSAKQISSAGTTFSQYERECGKCGALRIDDQIGLEETPEAYVEKLVAVFREVRRVLKDDGTLWLNLGDSYWGGKGKSGYELPEEAEARRANGETFQTGHNVPGNRDMRPTDGKHPVIKPKDLIGIPWMVAFALRADGWYLRSDIIWHKPNPMPESVTDRPTKAHEYIFLLSKSAQYYYDYEAILEPANYDGRKDTMMKGSEKYKNGFAPTDNNPNTMAVKGHERWSRTINGNGDHKNLDVPGRLPHSMHKKRAAGEEEINVRKLETGQTGDGHKGYYSENGELRTHEIDGTPARNKRTVWTVTTKPYSGAHFATFPPDLIEPCILAGSRVGDVVLDPFNGSGTTGSVAIKHHRDYLGIELNPEYIKLSEKRLLRTQPVLFPAA